MGGFFRAVQIMSSEKIENVAETLRSIFQLDPVKRVQMVNLVESVLPEVLPDYLFSVLPDEDMPGMAGITAIGEYTICLAESTYVALCNGDPDARMIAAHEFGHLILHSQQAPQLAKRTTADERVDPEWQADRFAEAWMMPWDGVAKCRSANHVAAKYSVPDDVAARRFAEVKMGKQIQGELF